MFPLPESNVQSFVIVAGISLIAAAEGCPASINEFGSLQKRG
jgi:hypothetical protein